jgi:hypothetical protein
MKSKTIEEKVEWYAMLHKQNLNGRETEDELFEAGILAGIEETIEERDECAIEFMNWCINNYHIEGIFTGILDDKNLLEIFKKEKGYE